MGLSITELQLLASELGLCPMLVNLSSFFWESESCSKTHRGDRRSKQSFTYKAVDEFLLPFIKIFSALLRYNLKIKMQDILIVHCEDFIYIYIGKGASYLVN